MVMLAAGRAVRVGQAANPGLGFDDPEWDEEEFGHDAGEDGWVGIWDSPPGDCGVDVDMPMEWEQGGEDGGSEGLGALVAEVDEVGFVAAKRFGGARAGFVFKKGDLGIGYYRDCMGSLRGRTTDSPMGTEDCTGVLGDGVGAPIVVRLAEYLGIEKKSAATVAVEETLKLIGGDERDAWISEGDVTPTYGGAGAKRKGRRNRKGRRGVGSCGAEFGDGEATAFTGGFKEAGLWAVDQINPNCGSGLANYLQITIADIVCSQEVKTFKGNP